MIHALFAILLFAQKPPEFKVISELASSLSEGNPTGAMDVFDKNTPGYETLSNNVYALIAQADLSCSIDPVEQIGHDVQVDWFLLIRSKQDVGPAERRQVSVKLTILQIRGKWKITAILPPTILDPPKI